MQQHLYQQHLYLVEADGQGGGGAGSANQETPAGSLALVAQLERLLSERQDLVRQLAALAPTDGAREQLGQRLQAITDEQERLLQELSAELSPEVRVA